MNMKKHSNKVANDSHISKTDHSQASIRSVDARIVGLCPAMRYCPLWGERTFHERGERSIPNIKFMLEIAYIF